MTISGLEIKVGELSEIELHFDMFQHFDTSSDTEPTEEGGNDDGSSSNDGASEYIESNFFFFSEYFPICDMLVWTEDDGSCKFSVFLVF